MKLNLGCGHWKLPGYVNVDSQSACEPDQVVDLEKIPWPFPDASADEIVMSHVLEHLGQQTAVYLAILKELYRVCAPDAVVRITVPHPRHDTFLIDPTHVRPILPESLRMLSKKVNLDWKAKGIPDTPLGVYLDVDFEVVDTKLVCDPMFQAEIDAGKLGLQEVLGTSRLYNNVIKEQTITLRAVKGGA